MKLFFLMLFWWAMAYSETQVFEGIAKYEGQVVYYERHTVVYDDQTIIKSLTEYFDPDGKIIGSMKSDYTHHLGAPTYVLLDRRHKSLQGLKWENNKPEVFAREQKAKLTYKRKIVPEEDRPMLSGPGLVYFIANNINQIIRKNGLEFQFVVPGRLDSYDFVVRPLKHNAKLAEFEVNIKQWWLRIFTPRLRLIFDVPTHRLLSFEGPANLRDTDGDMMSVEIRYKYED